MGAQNYYYSKANDVDAINDFSGTVSEVCADLWYIYGSMVINSAVAIARLEDETALWLHNFLRSILNTIRFSKNSRRFSGDWTPFDIQANHNLYKKTSSMDLERILTKDISPESFKDSSVDSTRHYFGPTRKIYVYSGVLWWISASYVSHMYLRSPSSKGTSMIHHFSRIP